MYCAISPRSRAALLTVDLVARTCSAAAVRPCGFRRDAQVRQRSEHVSAAAPYSDRSQPPHAHDLDAHEIAQALAKCDPPVLTSCIGRRALLAEAVVTGRLAFEMAHSAAAVRKTALAAEVERMA